MAKAYRALSNIRHGVADGDGNQKEMLEFPYGSIVSGLDADVMKNLWDAGVLEELDIPDAQVTKTTPGSSDQSGAAAGSTTQDGKTEPPAN